MAGWSILKNGSALDSADVIDTYKRSGFSKEISRSVKVADPAVGDDSDDDHEIKLRCLFYQVLLVFLNEAADRECIRPTPVLLGDGQSPDLFKLFWVVRRRGGFEMVNSFWTFVVNELGLDAGFSASVKLIYFKYLYELERWLRERSRGGRSRNGKYQCKGSISLPLELEAEFRSLLLNRNDRKEKGNRLASAKSKKNGKYINSDMEKSRIGALGTKYVQRECSSDGNRYTDDEEKIPDDNDDDRVILDRISVKKVSNARKRKRDSVSRMLSWVIQIAKCASDPSARGMQPQPNWKDYRSHELWCQAVRARDALFQRKQVESNTKQSLLQNSQKVHPSIYDDVSQLSDQSAEKLRCSERLPASSKSLSSPCCNSFSAPQGELMSPPKTEFENSLKEQELVHHDLKAANMFEDEHLHRHVPLGPHFQAEVPEWTSTVSESDSKWLGQRVWPSEIDYHNAPVETDPTGEGRPDFCGCQLPNSVECVRFHIAEKRMKLKRELGRVFFCWRFNCMGEEVSLRWTAEEEKRFKDMVRFNPPSLGKCFWDYAHKYFPRKTREDLVNYYFNVFLVRRRSYQNRVTPKHIDSDDDDSEFGSLSDIYGHEAVKVHGPDKLMCSENKQCIDFK